MKNPNTFTSVLLARSEAASGQKNLIVNIDESERHSELAATDYVDELYNHYRITENESHLPDYMASQPDINAKMRSILVYWLIQVHRKFELMPETLYLTINIVDRLLSIKVVPRKELQLFGISSMLIASKYEEIWAPEVYKLACLTDNAYVREQILFMEKTILTKLGWYVTVPTPYVTMSSSFGISKPRFPLIKRDCAELMVSYHSAAPESNLRLVYKKFCSLDRCAVALVTPAKNLSAQS